MLVLVITADIARAQNAQPNAEPSLAGWYGEMEWSFHHREDKTAPPGTSRSEIKFSGQAKVGLVDIGQGRLSGTLIGTQEVQIFWWGHSYGGPYAGQVCRGSAPPTDVFAFIGGNPPSGASSFSLELFRVKAQMRVEWSGGGPNVSCKEAPKPIDNELTLAGLFRSLQPVGDGTYKAEFDTAVGLYEAHWKLILRPGYCGHGPESGGVFAQSLTRGSVEIYSAPSSNSWRLISAPNGTRLIYDQTKQVSGEIWFHVTPPGKPTGWVSSRDLACMRPGELPPIHMPPDDFPPIAQLRATAARAAEVEPATMPGAPTK